jgi:hypothetical protein
VRHPFRAAAAFLAVFGLPLAGQQPLGPQFTVSPSFEGYQGQTAVGGNAAGGFVVAWTRQSFPGGDIFARRFTGAGDGGEFRVNTYTTGSQYRPAVAMSPSGAFVVVWDSYQEIHQIIGQRYSISGTPLGGEFIVDTAPYGAFYPRVAYESNGDFVVVWSVRVSSSIGGQRFNGSGVPLGANFPVNSTAGIAPDVASLGSLGGFVVTWNASSAPDYVYAQRFDSSGNPAGGEFRVSTMTAATGISTSAPLPRVASDPAGNFAIAWMADSSAGADVSARRYAAAGAPFGSDFQVDLDPSPTASYLPQVGVGADGGGFLVAWARNRGGGDVDIRARHIPGGEIRVNTYTTGLQKAPAVAALAPGQFVVAWQSKDQNGYYGIFGQRVGFRLTGDVDGNGVVNVNDIFYLINFLFAGGPPPPIPQPGPEAPDL